MAAAAPAANPVVLIVVVVVLVGILGYFLLKSYYQLAIAPGSASIQVDQTAAFAATLSRKSWAFGSYSPVAATFTVKSGNALVASPVATTVVSTEAAPSGAISINGVTAGTATIGISASDGKGNAGASVTVTVTSP